MTSPKQPKVFGGLNAEWAVKELTAFIHLVTHSDARSASETYVGTDEQVAAQLFVVERIWQRTIGAPPRAAASGYDPYAIYRMWAAKCVSAIEREAEVRENLGDDAPTLNASRLHPWVWDGARSLWQSGHYGEAVEAAAKKVNAEAQNKVGRRDIAETDLFNQVFSKDQPEPNNPRLRLSSDDGGKTALSVRRGIRAFAEGCFAAMRNPLAHDGVDLSDTTALEQLAALSILARWVDAAELKR